MKKILITADIHFERVLKEEDGFDNMINYFIKSIRENTFDIFIIAGDITHSRHLRMESDEARLLIKFISKILSECEKKHVSVVILKGTPSHDGDVTKTILETLSDRFSNFVYVDTISELTVKGTDILLLPEVYMASYEEFEKELYSKMTKLNYDILVFHNMFDFAIPALSQIDSKFNLGRSLVLDSDSISKLATIVIGGHIHSHINKGNVYYTGRFTNERGHSSSDVYGIKMVMIENNNYRIINLSNPYLINQDVVELNFSTITDVELERRTGSGDLKDKIFLCYLTSSPTCQARFKKWCMTYNPPYIKRKIIDTNNRQIDMSDISKETSIKNEVDVISLLKELYKNKYGDDLEDDILGMLVKGEE